MGTRVISKSANKRAIRQLPALDEVNEHRALLGKPPVDAAAIERVERWALGHSDYSSKFALYCAELALDTGPVGP